MSAKLDRDQIRQKMKNSVNDKINCFGEKLKVEI